MTAAQVTENDADKWRLRKNFQEGNMHHFQHAPNLHIQRKQQKDRYYRYLSAHGTQANQISKRIANALW